MSSQENNEKSDDEETPIVSSVRPEDVDKDVLPLTFPACIRKSSKDPNRGLYPKRKLRSNSTMRENLPNEPSVSFRRASDLYRSALANGSTPTENRLNKSVTSNFQNPLSHSRLNKKIRVQRLNHDYSNSLASVDNVRKLPSSSVANISIDIYAISTASRHPPSNSNEPQQKRRRPNCPEPKDPSKNTLLNYYSKREGSRNAKKGIGSISSSVTIKAVSLKEEYGQKQLSKSLTGLELNRKENGRNDVVFQNVLQSDTKPSSTYIPSIETTSYEVDQEMTQLNDPCCSRTVSMTAHSSLNSMARFDIDKSSSSESEDALDLNSETPFVPNTDEEPYHFGLFGASDKCNEESVGEDYFQYLPVHVTEQILRQIPFLDLMKIRSVCKSWNEIINNSKFLEWRKAYYTVKSGYSQPACWQSALSYFNEDAICAKTCFSALIRFLDSELVRKPSNGVQTFLSRFPCCVNAKSLLVERFPDQLSLSENSWCILCVTILFSKVVEDVYKILHCLKRERPFQYEDVLETMFCIATSLLYFIRTFSICHGPHYRLYNSIYLLENKLPGNSASTSVKLEIGLSGQQSLHSYCDPIASRMTYEQIRILNHRLRPNQRVTIIAFAGTGKTSTLIQFARIYSNLKFLNVMFNKAVCDYAKSRFPPNVVCKTAHSLAYQAVGVLYKDKLNFKLKPHDIIPFLNKPKKFSLHTFTYARCVLLTIENFTQSADEHITTAHVPKSIPKVPDRLGVVREGSTLQVVISDQERLTILGEAEKLWLKMVSRSEKDCRITHDVYLKIFQLKHPTVPNYDCIMIDEAQDCNPAMLDIILSQHVPVILVGDPNQQIYAFRGATNCFQNIDSTHTYHLTKSFRFGPEIAYVASSCLEVLKKNTQSTLIGDLKESYVDGTVKGQYAVIARTNEKLIIEAIRLCCTSERREFEPQNVYGAFAGGIAGYGLDQIIDIRRLKMNEPKSAIKDKFIKKFQDFYDLRLYAMSTDDKNMLIKIELVIRYGENIIDYIKQIKRKCAHDVEMANIVFSTAHKAKGLEFDTVALVNDYQVGSFPRNSTNSNASCNEEYNILYVALTRAKKCLVMCEKLQLVLAAGQEKFEYPMLSSTVLTNLPKLDCAVCSQTWVPHTAFTLVRRNIVLASGRQIRGGPLCMKCATCPYYIPEAHSGPAVMMLDPLDDAAHISQTHFVGPLPSEAPIVHATLNHYHEDIGPFFIHVVAHPFF